MSDMKDRIEALSPRQFETLVCVARHLSSREIGNLLGLSPATVDSHIAAALQKLGLANRRQAALRLIDLGLAPSTGQGSVSQGPDDLHHGDAVPSNLHQLSAPGGNDSLVAPGPVRGRPSRGDGDRSRSLKSGMAQVIGRYLLDGLYVVSFFAVMSAVALFAHWIVIECERSQIDRFVLLVLKGVSYMLVILDAVGVVTVTGLLTWRFIRATMKADDPVA